MGALRVGDRVLAIAERSRVASGIVAKADLKLNPFPQLSACRGLFWHCVGFGILII
jgi:hypothetical protein